MLSLSTNNATENKRHIIHFQRRQGQNLSCIFFVHFASFWKSECSQFYFTPFFLFPTRVDCFCVTCVSFIPMYLNPTVPSLPNCVCIPVSKPSNVFFLLASHFWILACWLYVFDFSSHVCAWPSDLYQIIEFVFWTWFSCLAPSFLSGPTLAFADSVFLSRSSTAIRGQSMNDKCYVLS